LVSQFASRPKIADLVKKTPQVARKAKKMRRQNFSQTVQTPPKFVEAAAPFCQHNDYAAKSDQTLAGLNSTLDNSYLDDVRQQSAMIKTGTIVNPEAVQ